MVQTHFHVRGGEVRELGLLVSLVLLQHDW